MKSGSSVVGTPFTSIRHLDNQAIAVESTPERAVENSLTASLTVPRMSPTVDEAQASAFKATPESDAEARIGINFGNRRSQ